MPAVVFLSPHFDDVALSCGGRAAQLAAGGVRGLCITLFAAPPPPGEPLTAYALRLHTRWGEPDPAAGNALRRAEEQAALARLGLDLVLLPYGDAIYRAGRYTSNAAIFGALDPAEADWPATLAARLEDALRGRGLARGATLVAPLGLGHHVDHQLVFAAARLLAARGWPVEYYEDFPYAAKADARTSRFAALGLGADPPPDAAAPRYYDIGAGMAAKIAAIAAYASQISSLFPSAAAMPAAVRDYAAGVAADWRQQGGAAGPATGGPRFAERYWRLAAPAPFSRPAAGWPARY